MDLLGNLISTVGLNSSFFYQLILAVLLYFILKRVFLQPYLESFEKRQKFTKGRLKSSKKLEEQIEENKKLYEQKAKLVHEKFREVFNKIKLKAQEDYQVESLKVYTEQKNFIEKERDKLKRSLKEQEVLMGKELPFLIKLLVEKMKS